MINIVTDSCADLSKELIARFQIDIIRLSVFIDNQTFLDGLEIQPTEIFTMVAKTNVLPKTSAPPVGEYLKLFDRPGDTLYLGISSKLSASVANAVIARQNLDEKDIHVVDTNNLSSGIGLLVLLAAELRDQGYSASQIALEIQARIPKVHTAFIIDSLDYLYMGGRCSAMSHIVGSLLKIRPVIEVRQDGTLGVRDKIRGTRKRALDALIDDFSKHRSEIDPHRVFITHTGCDQDAQYLAEEIKTLFPIEELCITTAGSTIASHCGPDTIGIIYLAR